MTQPFITAAFDDWFLLLVVISSIISSIIQAKNKAAKKKSGTKPAPSQKAPSLFDNLLKQLSEQVAPLQTEPKIAEENHWEEDPMIFESSPLEQKPPIVLSARETNAEEPATERRPETVKLEILHNRSRSSDSQGFRMPSMSRTTARTHYNLKNKKALKHAILGQLIFGPPRAYDLSFDNSPSQK